MTEVMADEAMADNDQVLSRFNRLIQDLFRENVNRNCFQPWEIELLLDMQTCELRESNKREVLRQYQKAVQRQLEKKAGAPLKMSEYLTQKRSKRSARPVECRDPDRSHPSL